MCDKPEMRTFLAALVLVGCSAPLDDGGVWGRRLEVHGLGVSTASIGGIAPNLVEEHIEPRAFGAIEQSWRFSSAPSAPIDVRVVFDGMRAIAQDDEGVTFMGLAGGPRVRYGAATFIDADGARTSIPLAASTDSVSLTIPLDLIERSRFPAVLDPVIGPVIDTCNPVFGTGSFQYNVAVAFDGTNYLAVWEDPRGSVGTHLYATRISPTGAVLDPYGIAIGAAAVQQFRPSVTFGGGNYLIGYQQRGGSFGTSHPYVARVSPAGAVLDSAGVRLSPAAFTTEEQNVDVAFDGTNFLAVWQVNVSNGGRIDGARVSAAGTVLDTTPLRVASIAASFAQTQSSPAVEWVGSNYLVVWYDDRATWDIYGARVTASGTVMDGPSGFAIGTAATSAGRPHLAFDGTNALVVWSEFTSSTDADIFARRVSPSGALIDAAPFAVSNGAGRQDSPDVDFDGTQFVVAWAEVGTQPYAMTATRISTAGTVLDVNGVSLGSSRFGPTLAFGGGRHLVGFMNVAPTSFAWGELLSTSLGSQTGGAGFGLASAPNTQLKPATSFDGVNHLVSWADNRHGGSTIYASRISRAGGLLDSTGFRISPSDAGSQSDPASAFNGTHHLVVWQDNRGMVARRVSPSGAIVDAQDIVLTSECCDPRVASNGSDFLVVWSVTGFDVHGVRVSASGTVLDATPIAIASGPGTQMRPRAAWDGQNWVIVWYDSTSTPVRVGMNRMTPQGALLDGPGGVRFLSDAGSQTNPDVTSDGTQSFVVWSQSTPEAIFGARVSRAGVVLDSPGLTIAVEPQYHVYDNPRVRWDGVGFVTMWEDTVFNSSFSMLSFDLYATTTSPSGVSAARTQVATAAPTEYYEPDLSSDDAGTTLLVYQVRATSGATELRPVKGRLYSQTPAAGSCTTGATCASGFCVDGVCCNSACGGGSLADCQACAVAAGAAIDGTCGAVTNGRSCSDGNACTQIDSCQAGGCLGSSPRVCSPSDGCHLAGTCAPATGVCSNPLAPDGTACPSGVCSVGVCRAPVDGGIGGGSAGGGSAGGMAGGGSAGGVAGGRAGGASGGGTAGGASGGGASGGVTGGGVTGGGVTGGGASGGGSAGGSSAGGSAGGNSGGGSLAGGSAGGANTAGGFVNAGGSAGGGGTTSPPGCGCGSVDPAPVVVALAALGFFRRRRRSASSVV